MNVSGLTEKILSGAASTNRMSHVFSLRMGLHRTTQRARIVLNGVCWVQKNWLPIRFLVLGFSVVLSLAALAQTPNPTTGNGAGPATEAKTAEDSANNSGEDAPVAGVTIERIGLLPDQSPSWLVTAIEREQPRTLPQRLTVDNREYLALLQPSQGASSKGLVVLLPDRAQHPDWPQIIRPLRNGLAEAGWTTLAMTFPVPRPTPPPARPVTEPTPTAAEDNSATPEATPKEPGDSADAATTAPDQPEPAAPDTAEPTAGPPMPLLAMIDELTKQALALVNSDENERLILVGVGDGGYWAARWAADLMATKEIIVPKLVLINPRNQLPGESLRIRDFLNDPIPVLDLSENRNSAEAKDRKLAAQQAGFKRYQQQQLPLGDEAVEQRLINRINGFAQRY